MRLLLWTPRPRKLPPVRSYGALRGVVLSPLIDFREPHKRGLDKEPAIASNDSRVVNRENEHGRTDLSV